MVYLLDILSKLATAVFRNKIFDYKILRGLGGTEIFFSELLPLMIFKILTRGAGPKVKKSLTTYKTQTESYFIKGNCITVSLRAIA